MEPQRARRLWTLFEPYHAVYFFAEEARDLYTAAGLKGGWMAYFAGRSAAMGPVSPEVVIATFYNFHPSMVRRAIPDAWRYSSPEKVLDVRMRVVDGALRRLLGDQIAGDDVKGAAYIAARAVEACRPEGRPLFAAEAAQPIPDEPHVALWRHSTCLREHRGDGHVAALTTEGIDGCAAHVLMSAIKGVDDGMMRQFRGWSEEEWADAVARMQERGFHDGTTVTPAGRDCYARIEAHTDELAAEPWNELDDAEIDRFEQHMTALYPRISDGAVPYPNPMGVPKVG
ncbi:MAG TPA: hypothetical protein VG408_10305 [Actinomycetota bacterium]|nr:hypothetical protein [Actinomycetota bacterium]